MVSEREIRGMERAAPDRSVEIGRRRDLLDVAQTPAGRRVLREWLRRHRDEIEGELRDALPRDLFLEIYYPQKETHSRPCP